MNTNLKNFIENLDLTNIPENRKQILHSLIDLIQNKFDNQQDIKLNFICTHNSRRSHLGQVWAHAMAEFYEIPNVQSFSGGTEETAVYPQIIATLESNGFIIKKSLGTNNPAYLLQTDSQAIPLVLISKTFDTQINPAKNFVAIMTCAQADEDCPFVPGAENRIALTYEDPKKYDESTQKTQKYLDKSAEIATELKYVFSKIKKK